MKPELLVKFDREGFIEKLHYGFVMLIDEAFQVIYRKGDDENMPFPFRSGAKPLQATAVIDSGIKVTGEELAVICASHTGTPVHQEKVRSILKKAGLNESYLKCPPEHNCSGKHAGMLTVCVKNGWDTASYLEKDHPLQKYLLQKITELCHLPGLPPVVRDGCGAPVPVLSHYNMCIGFLNTFSAYTGIREAMAQNPFLAGGENRLDSDIIKDSEGKLIAKVAAEGVCIVVNPDKKLALLVKITDADRKAREVAVKQELDHVRVYLQ